jgi:hypothetical protein
MCPIYCLDQLAKSSNFEIEFIDQIFSFHNIFILNNVGLLIKSHDKTNDLKIKYFSFKKTGYIYFTSKENFLFLKE